ncbi:hypothetical protein [Amycolatopsis kentuckyensis]|uniref:hypothetical protein n=1 Tax=Amycolatopsis kentuckyensis TaxID=218823 RepID=UPI001ABF3D77|nr:hypothetical protein [Amycolatopsis kentuckyensis]
MALVYATLGDLAGSKPEDVTLSSSDTELTRQLASASREIRRATKTAIYDTDTDGYPTDTDVREAFRLATCAQVYWWAETGDEQGVAGQFTNVSIGPVSMSRGGGSAGSGAAGQGRLAPAADTILRDAGVLAGAIVASYPWEGR